MAREGKGRERKGGSEDLARIREGIKKKEKKKKERKKEREKEREKKEEKRRIEEENEV